MPWTMVFARGVGEEGERNRVISETRPVVSSARAQRWLREQGSLHRSQHTIQPGRAAVRGVSPRRCRPERAARASRHGLA